MTFSGDHAEQTYRTYFPLVREKCRRMLANPHEAQDVAQETMVRLWKANLMQLPPPQLTAWLYRTSTRLAVDVLRKARWETRDVPLDRASNERPDEQLDTRRHLAMLARRVPARELEVAVLHRVDGLTQEELAEVLDTTDRTVRRLLAKLDERLARIREETS
jgi:RNA polymerase sigma-70 factor (ECF subfamily)